MSLPIRKNPRAKRYDYASWGIYFITFCTQNREHFLGDIENEEMVLSKIGHICDEEIQIMLEKRPSVDIHEYVIMPNHIHILLGMEGSDQSNDTKITNQTLGSIICGLKSAITKHCHEQGYVFARQSRYHDHIVRDEQAYDNIKFYIQQNPKKWKEDKFWVEI